MNKAPGRTDPFAFRKEYIRKDDQIDPHFVMICVHSADDRPQSPAEGQAAPVNAAHCRWAGLSVTLFVHRFSAARARAFNVPINRALYRRDPNLRACAEKAALSYAHQKGLPMEAVPALTRIKTRVLLVARAIHEEESPPDR